MPLGKANTKIPVLHVGGVVLVAWWICLQISGHGDRPDREVISSTCVRRYKDISNI